MSTEPEAAVPAELPEPAEHALDDALALLCRYGLSRAGAFSLLGRSMLEGWASVLFAGKKATVDFDPDVRLSQYFYIGIEKAPGHPLPPSRERGRSADW